MLEGPLESRGIDGKTNCESLPPNCSIPNISVRHQDVGVIGGGKRWKPWPGNEPRYHKKSEQKNEC
jgi:hypothetical protein